MKCINTRKFLKMSINVSSCRVPWNPKGNSFVITFILLVKYISFCRYFNVYFVWDKTAYWIENNAIIHLYLRLLMIRIKKSASKYQPALIFVRRRYILHTAYNSFNFIFLSCKIVATMYAWRLIFLSVPNSF